MNAKEVIKELREYTYWSGASNGASRDIHPSICDIAANLIETLQAQLKDASQRGLYYMEQLEESRRREKAAVEMLKQGGDACAICEYAGGHEDCPCDCKVCSIACSCKECSLGSNFVMCGAREDEYRKQVDDDYMAHMDVYCP